MPLLFGRKTERKRGGLWMHNRGVEIIIIFFSLITLEILLRMKKILLLILILKHRFFSGFYCLF